MATLETPPLPNEEQIPDVSETDGEAQEPESQFGPANESLPKELRNAIMDRAKKFCEEDRYSRRMEVQESRRAHFFWRSIQHLTWDWRNEGWQILGPAGASATTATEHDTSLLYTTNIWQAFGLSIQAVLTQNMPSIRFEPADPDNAADVATAKESNDLRKVIEHQNDAVKLLTELAYLAWCDGRIAALTIWEKDKRTGRPRETISMHGSLEIKVPITAPCQDEYIYLQYSRELHKALVRGEVAEMEWPGGGDVYAKKIQGGAIGNGQDVYERTARISTQMGVTLLTGSTDTLSNLVTRQQTWMRKEAFKLIDDDDIRTRLEELFPNGCKVRSDNGVYTGSWNENMDDTWAVMHALPGDGQFRNSIGHTSLPVQERFNDIANITQDIYEKCQPAAWIADTFTDTDGVWRQQSRPGARYSGPKKPGEPIGDNFFFEPAATVSPDMLEYGNELVGPQLQFMTGAFPALFGGSPKNTDTAAQFAMQRDQAMGRIGLIWRSIKRFWAQIMEQAVRCAAKNRKEDASIGIPDEHGEIETTTVRVENLRGKVFCYPDSDENFPESWTQKRAAYMALLPMADANPVLAQSLMEPQNQELGRKLIGLDEFVIAGAEAARKQTIEIAFLLKTTPVPNPALLQLEEQRQMMLQSSQAGQIHDDMQITALQQQLASTPQEIPSIQIDPEIDDNAMEAETGKRWLNSEEGMAAKQNNQQGYANVRLHVLQHIAAAKAQAPPMPMPPPKGKIPPPQAPPAGGIAA